LRISYLLVDELSAGGAETILAHLATAAISAVEVRVLGGAMASVPDGATSFGHRRAKLMVNIAAMDKRVEERAEPEHETWAAGRAEALSGVVTTPAYVGFIGEEGEDGVRPRRPGAPAQRVVLLPDRHG
jgi:hypothetical protein